MPDSSAPFDAPLITGVPTSIPAFIGSLPGDDRAHPVRVRNWRQFREWFPVEDIGSGILLPGSLRSFFANGGTTCYILNIPQTPGVERLAAYEAGLAALEKIEEISILVAPDLWREEGVDGSSLVRAVAGHCAKMRNRLLLLDMPEDLGPVDAAVFSKQLRLDESVARYVTAYYPWIEVRRLDGTAEFLPPAAAVASAYGRVARERGVHQAPVNVRLAGVSGLKVELTDEEQELLGTAGVNCLRKFENVGALVWGARTLSDDPEAMDIRVFRLVTFLTASIRKAMYLAGMVPDTEVTWARIGRSVSGFLADQWRNGALLGGTAEEAFYVTCDQSNNPPETVAQGIVNIHFGVAVERPGEFIDVRLSVPAGQSPTSSGAAGPAQESEATPEGLAALALEYRDGSPVLVAGGGAYIPARIEVLNGEGNPTAAYTAGPATPTTRVSNAVDDWYLHQDEDSPSPTQ